MMNIEEDETVYTRRIALDYGHETGGLVGGEKVRIGGHTYTTELLKNGQILLTDVVSYSTFEEATASGIPSDDEVRNLEIIPNDTLQ